MRAIFRVGVPLGFSVVASALAVSFLSQRQNPRQVEGNEWKVAGTPSVVLGSEGDSVLFEFVYTAARRSDGRIVVADGLLNSRLLEFTPDGYRGLIGRSGAGPGEFRWITSLQVGPNDSLIVFDTSLQRLTVYSPDGRLARAAQYHVQPGWAGTEGPLSSVSRLADGTWIGHGHETFRQGRVNELLRDTIAIGSLSPELREFRPILHLAGRMTTTTLLFGRPVYRVPAFSPEVIHTTWGRCIFASAGETQTISVYTSSGEMITTLVGPGEPRPVTQEHLEDRLNFDLNNIPNADTVALRRLIADEAHPAFLPYYKKILADEWGHLWLQEYSPPWGAGRRWYVMSQSGERLGEVEMPKRMEVYEIRDGAMLGRTYGEFGEHRVELFQLVSHPPSVAGPLPECVP